MGHSRAGKVSMLEKWTEPPTSTTLPIWLLMEQVALMPQCNQRLAIPRYPNFCTGCFLWLRNIDRILGVPVFFIMTLEIKEFILSLLKLQINILFLNRKPKEISGLRGHTWSQPERRAAG